MSRRGREVYSLRNPVFFEGANRTTQYYLTTFGIYKTNDGGRILRKADSHLPLRELRWMYAVGPPGHFLVMTAHNRIFETVDAGEHWKEIAPLPIGGSYYDNFTQVASTDSQARHLFAIGGSHLFESEDHGKTWTDISERFDGAAVGEMTDPQSAMFCVSTGRGIYRKTER